MLKQLPHVMFVITIIFTRVQILHNVVRVLSIKGFAVVYSAETTLVAWFIFIDVSARNICTDNLDCEAVDT